MMFPHDPLRQKMLVRTEWKTLGASGDTPELLAASSNKACAELLNEGFTITQMMPLTPARGIGVLLIATRITSPVADPTPHGVPVAGTHAVQSLEISYSFVEQGVAKTQKMKTLQEAVRLMARDQEESAGAGTRQPISIHVTSVTAYGPADFHVLREKFG
jgi:hypothetical protein